MIDEITSTYEPWINDLMFYFMNPGNKETSLETKRLSVKYAFNDGNIYRRVGIRYVLIPKIFERQDILN